MPKQQLQHSKVEVAYQALICNAKAAGATMKCRNSRRYNVMQKLQALKVIQIQQALHCNAEAAGATL
jgi:hypothetical protein